MFTGEYTIAAAPVLHTSGNAHLIGFQEQRRQLTLTNRGQQPLEFTLTNLRGEMVITNNIHGKNHTLDLGNLPSGLYFIKLKNAEASSLSKLFLR